MLNHLELLVKGCGASTTELISKHFSIATKQVTQLRKKNRHKITLNVLL